MRMLKRIYQQKLTFRKMDQFFSDSIESKLINTIKDGFYFILGYDKQVK